MKKKSIILASSIIILAILAFFATNFVRNRGKSDTELLEFSISDTTSINKIIITEPSANRIELIRNENNIWVDGKGDCITQEPIQTILETIKNVEFKGYVPENSRTNITKRMATIHTKVELFQKGEWVKTWYIGYSTQDHYGTYMLLETPKEKSDLPVIMKVKGLNGIIEPRFFADARKWKCTRIFNLERDEITSVDVRFTENKERNFSITKDGNKFMIKQNGQLLPAVDTTMAIRYLNNYKKIHFELVNYELNDKQVDSVKRSKPFCTLSVKEVGGNITKLKMFRLKGNGETILDDFGDSVSHDPNRFWCQLPSGELVKCQYFVFNPLLMGHIYFATKPE
jgi:hypothetical protein